MITPEYRLDDSAWIAAAREAGQLARCLPDGQARMAALFTEAEASGCEALTRTEYGSDGGTVVAHVMPSERMIDLLAEMRSAAQQVGAA